MKFKQTNMRKAHQTTPGKRRSFIKKSLAGLAGLISYPMLAESSSTNNFSELLKNDTGSDIFSLVRKQLLINENMVYMNTGSLGPSPRLVIDKVSEVVHQLERNPVSENWGPLGKQMEVVRENAANFINAQVDEVILTRNTTEGLSMVGSTLKLKKGDEILTTNHEHGGGEVGLEYLADRTGAVIKKIEMPMPAQSKEQIVELIRANITRKTKVILLSHVVTITGLRMPIEEVSQITREQDILFVVDGAQAPGMLAIDVKKLGADVYATSGHKWLMAPKETGIVYIRKEVQDRIKPVFTASGYGSYSASSGTRNVANIIGLGEAISWHELIGKQEIEERILELSAYCRESLLKIDGLEIISPSDRGLSSALVSVRLLNSTNADIYKLLKDKNIIVKLLPKYNALRFSTHMFNSFEDIDKLVVQLRVLISN